MPPEAALLLALGLPLALLAALTFWLISPRRKLPATLTWLVARSGTIWVSGMVLMTTVLLVRQLLSRGR